MQDVILLFGLALYILLGARLFKRLDAYLEANAEKIHRQNKHNGPALGVSRQRSRFTTAQIQKTHYSK